MLRCAVVLAVHFPGIVTVPLATVWLLAVLRLNGTSSYPSITRLHPCCPGCPCRPAVLLSWGAQGAAKKTLTGAVSFLKDLTHTASNLYHKRTDDEEEEAEYLKVGRAGGLWVGVGMCVRGWGRTWTAGRPVFPFHRSLPARPPAHLPACPPPQVRAYVHELERHLGEVHRQAARLVRHQAELGESVREFGAAMTALGRYEESVSEGLAGSRACGLFMWVGGGRWTGAGCSRGICLLGGMLAGLADS